MSLSYYYTARRKKPLTDAERAAIKVIEERFSVEEQIEKRLKTGKGPNWESFCGSAAEAEIHWFEAHGIGKR